ncbi:hypothetical protein Alches_18700 [Alicyclobacillus hesperidum subsp. aegles]|uniref:hypothetical protein n=1 Tax=Alicyclobacillus hesperidum TaxID=89784 RepID=UPI00222AC399|nr:hypothetical protein [Alicyclobacillus hesperidum]GLG01829.1 hypothetical protein Alches_18700 [Alicyclobacillus hesperidum subsp. aegles]
MNLAGVVSNSHMSQTVTIFRKGGSWVGGRWQPTEVSITARGVVDVPDPTELEQVPEGDRQKGAIRLYTATPVMLTNTSGTSDEILWRGNRYRVMQVIPYADYGYYKAIAVKMDPATEVSS